MRAIRPCVAAKAGSFLSLYIDQAERAQDLWVIVARANPVVPADITVHAGDRNGLDLSGVVPDHIRNCRVSITDMPDHGSAFSISTAPSRQDPALFPIPVGQAPTLLPARCTAAVQL